MYKSGWRPMIGWVAVVALVEHFIVLPVILLILNPGEPPSMDAGSLLTLVLALLGVGAYRSYEKKEELTDV